MTTRFHLHSQADVVDVSPGTEYTVTVTASSSSSASASSSNISPGVSRMINTNESGEMSHTSTHCTVLLTCRELLLFHMF